MTISSVATDALLAERELGNLVARASVRPCEASKFHSPRPLVTKLRTWRERDYWLCGNCAANLEIYLMLLTEDPELPWAVQREFGNEVRRIGNEILSIEMGNGIQHHD